MFIEKMKKFLFFLVLASVLFGVCGVLADTNVTTQNASVGVGTFVNVSVNPNLTDFGSTYSPATRTGNTLTFNPDSSNVNMTISVLNVIGEPFASWLNLDGIGWMTRQYTFICSVNAENLCTFNSITSVPTVYVTSGHRSGVWNGSIIFMVNNNQSLNFSTDLTLKINQVINVAVTPANLDFGSVLPGTTVTGPLIVFNATNSNADLIVVYTSVSGSPFNGNLKLNDLDAGLFNVSMGCISTGESCTYNTVQATPKLTIPAGYVAGVKTGVITYTITGTDPSQI